MGNNRIYLANWNYDGDRVRLLYSDKSVLFVSKADFNRAFGSIVNADKYEVVRDFAIKDGEE